MNSEDRSQKSEVRSKKVEVGSRKLSSGFCILNSVPRGLVRRSLGEGGFTLIELLVVITIIAILAGLIIGGAGYAWRRAGVTRTKGEIKTFESALEDYKADNGIYPRSTMTRLNPASNSGSLLAALVSGPKKYFNFKPDQTQQVAGVVCIVDPLGNPYNYYCNPGAADQTNRVTFDLWSYGSDGLDGTADDIANWQSF
jgi:general secretion pathway protein G